MFASTQQYADKPLSNHSAPSGSPLSNSPGHLWRVAASLTLWPAGCFLIVALFVGSSTTSEARGQAPRNGKPDNSGFDSGVPNATMEIAKAEGKIEARQGQRIKILTAENKDVFIDISQETAVRYSGEADPSWLSPGLMVRFSTKFDQGKPVAPLKNLEIFVPLISNRMTMEQTREQTAGVYQEGKVAPAGAQGLFNDADKPQVNKPGASRTAAGRPGSGKTPTEKATAEKASGSKPGGRAASKPGADAEPAGNSPTYRVVGEVRGNHGNSIIVMTDQPMQFEIEPSATITVTSSDLSFVSQGDTVSVSGLRSPLEPAYIRAERMEIKAGKKLTQAQTSPRGRTRGGARGQRGEAADAKDSDGANKPAGNSKDPRRPTTDNKKSPSPTTPTNKKTGGTQ